MFSCSCSYSSLVPRPPRPAFVACSMKAGGRPGRIYHVMRATADVTFSLLTSGFVLSPSLFFPWIQFVLSVQFVLWVWLLLDRLWLATVRDVSSGTHHVINPVQAFSPLFILQATKAGRGGLGTRLGVLSMCLVLPIAGCHKDYSSVIP